MGLTPIILIPLFVSLFVLIRQSPEKAVLNVYLPVLICFPIYDQLKLPGLPFLNFNDTTILPIGIYLLATKWRRWRFTRMDLWMLFFGISSGVGMFLRNTTPTPGIFGIFGFTTQALFPYVIGKILIEQSGIRLAVMKRVVFLLAVVAIISLYEYRMGMNPFHAFWARLIPNDGLGTFEQARWGMIRVSGPYFRSETAGMVYVTGSLFAYWLYKYKYWEPKLRYIPHPFKKGTIIFGAVLIGMFINQARGPYLGVALGLFIMWTFREKKLGKSVRNSILLLAIISVPAYTYMHNYTTANFDTASQDQQNAIYRSLMFDNYMPIVQEGGLYGWGPGFPVVPGQASIDNAFLLFALTQGYMGAAAFSLLIVDSMLFTFLSLRRLKQKQDRSFVFCVAGCIVGTAFSLGTVFLNEPVYELVFIFLGWSQSIQSTEVEGELSVPSVENTRYAYRRVFT